MTVCSWVGLPRKYGSWLWERCIASRSARSAPSPPSCCRVKDTRHIGIANTIKHSLRSGKFMVLVLGWREVAAHVRHYCACFFIRECMHLQPLLFLGLPASGWQWELLQWFLSYRRLVSWILRHRAGTSGFLCSAARLTTLAPDKNAHFSINMFKYRNYA